MTSPPFSVLADDLTGAAEIAGTASRFGLQSTVLLQPVAASHGGVTVWNLDSRLLDASHAAGIAGGYGDIARLRSLENVFIKVDSIFRGPLRPQLEVLAAKFGASRVVLAPANPSRGRVIRDGQYLINGVPLHETQFASDPHHPAQSSNPLELLGETGDWPVTLANPLEALPKQGIAIAETSTSEQMATLAAQLKKGTLAAGAADFFTAILEARGVQPVSRKAPHLAGPLFWICGSTASPDAGRFAHGLSRWSHSIPDAGELGSSIQQINQSLKERGLAILHTGQGSGRTLDPAWVQQALSGIAARVTCSGHPAHLLLEGGATAAAILRTLEFDALQTLHEWVPGVVSFFPAGFPELVITLKPGSYQWPKALFQHTDFPDQDLFRHAYE